MRIKEIELSKLKELKERSKMLRDKRQKGKVIYKMGYRCSCNISGFSRLQ